MTFTKEMTAAEVVSKLEDGMSIGVGGWGPRRKPMSIIREILKSDLKDLHVIAYGGPEIGMLCAAGKVRKLTYGFVSLDKIPVEPWFRKAREAGGLEISELDEGLLQWGLKAAAMRVPFLPTRVGLASDVMTANPGFKTVTSPYSDAEVLLAMPAIKPDVSLLHVDVADCLGNSLIHAPDPHFDEHFARAAESCYISCETLESRLQLDRAQAKSNYFERNVVSGVVHAPLGAHPTSNAPAYGWDMGHFKEYAGLAREEGGWAQYAEKYLSGSEDDYQQAVGGVDAIRTLELPIF